MSASARGFAVPGTCTGMSTATSVGMKTLSTLDLSLVHGGIDKGELAALSRYDLKSNKFLAGGTSQGDYVTCEPMQGNPDAYSCGVFAPDAKPGDAPKLSFPLYKTRVLSSPDAQ